MGGGAIVTRETWQEGQRSWSVATFRPEAFAQGAARLIAEALKESTALPPPRLVLLAGGRTPADVYRELARLEGQRWQAKDFVFALTDERIVGDEEAGLRNASLVEETLLRSLAQRPIFLSPPKGLSPEAAAERYEEALQAVVGPKPEPLVTILGLGTDGHTASLFPGDAALAEGERIVVAARAPSHPVQRITLTAPVLARSRHVFFLVIGREKAPILQSFLRRVPALPAVQIPFQGQVRVLADLAALP